MMEGIQIFFAFLKGKLALSNTADLRGKVMMNQGSLTLKIKGQVS